MAKDDVPLEQKNIALMNAAELLTHIEEIEERHRAQLRTLRALQRARAAEEASE